jgi:hypothetical protein
MPISGTHIAMKHVELGLFFDYCKETEDEYGKIGSTLYQKLGIVS